jgi:hypothetical protein
MDDDEPALGTGAVLDPLAAFRGGQQGEIGVDLLDGGILRSRLVRMAHHNCQRRDQSHRQGLHGRSIFCSVPRACSYSIHSTARAFPKFEP